MGVWSLESVICYISQCDHIEWVSFLYFMPSLLYHWYSRDKGPNLLRLLRSSTQVLAYEHEMIRLTEIMACSFICSLMCPIEAHWARPCSMKRMCSSMSTEKALHLPQPWQHPVLPTCPSSTFAFHRPPSLPGPLHSSQEYQLLSSPTFQTLSLPWTLIFPSWDGTHIIFLFVTFLLLW